MTLPHQVQSSLQERSVHCPVQRLKQERRSIHWLFRWFFVLHRTKSLLFNYCHISNHIQNKSQNDNVQIKAPQKMKALVHCNSVTCHSQSAPWFTKHFLITLPYSMQSSWQPWLLSWPLALPSCLDTRKTQGWDTARESAMTGDRWLLP